MPQFVTIIGCEAPEEVRPRLREQGIEAGEDTHTVPTLEDALTVATDVLSARGVRVLYRDTSDWLRYGVFVVDGDLVHHEVMWSLEEDALAEPEARPAAEVEVPLTVDADELLDLFEGASEGSEPQARGRTLVLPGDFVDSGKALHVLAQVAARLKPESIEALVELPRGHSVLTLERGKGATLTPLHPWLEDEEAQAFVRTVLGAPEPAAFQACPPKPAKARSQRDPSRPLTTGSLKARMDSALDVRMTHSFQNGLVKWAGEPGVFEQLEAAVRAPENAGASFAPLRATLYEQLLRCSEARAVPVLLSALEREDDAAARGQIYACLSKVEDAAAHRVLARGLAVEPPEVCERLAQVVWRQKGAVELLVREQLVPAWSADRALAHRIVKVLRDEYVEVHPAWLSGAPEELRKVLGPVLARE
jgi:hypothetical protein